MRTGILTSAVSSLPSNPREFGAIQQMEPHPPWVQDLAYNLWAFVCNQNVSEVYRMLVGGTYTDHGGIVPEDAYTPDENGELVPPKVNISRQAIQRWKNAHNWDTRWITEMRDLQPAIHQQVANNVMVASLEASSFLSRLVRGEIPITDPVAAKVVDTRAKVAQDILNRSGHMPYTRPSDGGPLPGPTVDHHKQFAGKSIEELRRMAIEGEIVSVE